MLCALLELLEKRKTFGEQNDGALTLLEIISFRVTVILLLGALYNDISFSFFAEVPLRHQTAEKVANLLIDSLRSRE